MDGILRHLPNCQKNSALLMLVCLQALVGGFISNIQFSILTLAYRDKCGYNIENVDTKEVSP
jgi:hypothetical protein